MALSASAAADLIVQQLKSVNPKINSEQEAKMKGEWEAILTGLFSHITTSGQVTGTTIVSGGSSSGSWPTTGTIS